MRACDSALRSSRHLEADSRTVGGELRAAVQWPILRASTLLGMDAMFRSTEDNLQITSRPGLEAMSTPTLGGDSTDGLLAPYIAQALSPTRWLDINLGLRLDHDTRFGNKLSPRSALGVIPWDGARLKLIYAEAFRAPTAYELTYTDPNSQIEPSNLGPETVRSIEGSIEQRFGRHRLSLGLFRSWWTGLVGLETLSEDDLALAIENGDLAENVGEAYRRTNLGRIDNYGFNGAYDGEALDGRLRFGLNLTTASTHVDTGDGSGSLDLPVAPNTFGNARASYDFGAASPGWPSLAAALRFMDRRLATRFYDGGFSPQPSAPPLLAVRLALTGPILPSRASPTGSAPNTPSPRSNPTSSAPRNTPTTTSRAPSSRPCADCKPSSGSSTHSSRPRPKPTAEHPSNQS